MENTVIEINNKQYNILKKEYRKAVGEGRESFEFQGFTLLTSYAKYLLEYIELTYNF